MLEGFYERKKAQEDLPPPVMSDEEMVKELEVKANSPLLSDTEREDARIAKENLERVLENLKKAEQEQKSADQQLH